MIVLAAWLLLTLDSHAQTANPAAASLYETIFSEPNFLFGPRAELGPASQWCVSPEVIPLGGGFDIDSSPLVLTLPSELAAAIRRPRPFAERKFRFWLELVPSVGDLDASGNVRIRVQPQTTRQLRKTAVRNGCACRISFSDAAVTSDGRDGLVYINAEGLGYYVWLRRSSRDAPWTLMAVKPTYVCLLRAPRARRGLAR